MHRWVLACLWLAMVWCDSAWGADRSYIEWRAACLKLPSNRSLEGRLPPRDLLPLRDFSELDGLLDRYFALSTNGPLASAANWVGGAPRKETFLNVSEGWFTRAEMPFEPFAEKVVLPADARVLLQGDLHGDIHSLIALIDRWNEKKWFDGFKVIDPNLHLFFLGDYTDRGLYGVEVLYTLFRLRLENPDRVHLGRGNHEDVSLVSRYGFMAEGRAKYRNNFNAAKILRAYDFLPVVIYLGAGTDFVQMCHGGMEPGYQPGDLLVGAGTNQFQLLGKIRQQEFLKRHPNWLPEDSRAAEDAQRYFKDFQPQAPTTPITLGFMWNDFTVFRDEPAFADNPDRAFVYGYAATVSVLAHAGKGPAKVHAVVRAHQHSGIANPMMRRLVASRGLFRHWQEANSPGAVVELVEALSKNLESTQVPRAIPEGSVWTLNVTPDSVYGVGNGFRFATTGVLMLGKGFGDWRMGAEVVDVGPLNPR